MIIPSRVCHKNKDLDESNYIFLLYNSETEMFSVVKGFFVKKTRESPWQGDEKVYEDEDFLERFPDWEDTVIELKAEIKKRLTFA